MNLLIGIGFVIAIIVMVVWPLIDEWFKDLEQGDGNWTEKW
jgi:hypothetical protein|tara:strand:+ start:77 stop:199 length:123 start_codon:yes stop_codon:yes gene_type:complete